MRKSSAGRTRKRSLAGIGGATAAGALTLAASGPAAAADCGALAGKTYGDATIMAATTVSPPSS